VCVWMEEEGGRERVEEERDLARGRRASKKKMHGKGARAHTHIGIEGTHTRPATSNAPAA
jgi:hypothetical protein